DHDHDHDHDEDGAAAGAGAGFTGAQPPPAEMESTENLADALVQICAGYLSARASTADNPDTYQVIIHAGVRAVTGAEPAAGAAPAAAPVPATGPGPGPVSGSAGVSAETPPFWHPAHPDRCHLDDGPALSPATVALIGCDATISTMIHDLSGAVIDVGRRTRKVPPALRRALRERDHGRCRYPGCDSRRTDAHHIRYWANGGQTNLANLISFCKRHHRLVHEESHVIAAAGTGFAFYTRDGTPVPDCPQLPPGPGGITTTHPAVITPATITPPHSGERLNLSLAIWIAFANAGNQAARRETTAAVS
ncbi:MAG TPA: HNH endonuclease signature motif containing protein, partial [Trebonia sp.]